MISHTSTVLKRLRELSRRTSPRERAQSDYKPEFDQKARIIRLAKIETFVIKFFTNSATRPPRSAILWPVEQER